MSDDLLRRLAQRLRPQDPESCLAELKTDPEFQGDLSWLESTLKAADFLPVADVPEDLHNRLAGLLATREPSPPDTPVEDAVQVHDSRDSPEFAGVRSAALATRDTWSLLFSAPSADLLIDVAVRESSLVRLSGQLLPRSGGRVRFSVHGGGISAAVEGDEYNTFVLDGVTGVDNTFLLVTDGYAIRWQVEIPR